jgi:hypothetical protein
MDDINAIGRLLANLDAPDVNQDRRLRGAHLALKGWRGCRRQTSSYAARQSR